MFYRMHEMGIYDLPAEIDYALNVTGKKKLYFVGYSLGNTLYLILASQRPEYQSKILQNHVLAPVSFLTINNIKPIVSITQIRNILVIFFIISDK